MRGACGERCSRKMFHVEHFLRTPWGSMSYVREADFEVLFQGCSANFADFIFREIPILGIGWCQYLGRTGRDSHPPAFRFETARRDHCVPLCEHFFSHPFAQNAKGWGTPCLGCASEVKIQTLVIPLKKLRHRKGEPPAPSSKVENKDHHGKEGNQICQHKAEPAPFTTRFRPPYPACVSR